jgi:hypothetical protein
VLFEGVREEAHVLPEVLDRDARGCAYAEGLTKRSHHDSGTDGGEHSRHLELFGEKERAPGHQRGERDLDQMIVNLAGDDVVCRRCTG